MAATTYTSSNTVFGKVTEGNGRPLSNLKVTIYDVDLRDWQLLAEGVTDREGKYDLTWQHSQLKGRGRGEADIAVKITTKERGTELYKSSMDEVRFNASEREEINVTLTQAPPKEVIEFDFLVKEVSFLANKVAIAELQENKDHQDVTFISKELSVLPEKIEHLIVAHRLQNASQITAAFFYALFRKDTLLRNDFFRSLSFRAGVGLGDDDQVLLYDLALTDRKKMAESLQIAINEKIIGPDIAKGERNYLAVLTQYKERAEAYYKDDQPKKIIRNFAGFVKDEKLQELLKEPGISPQRLFDQVTDPALFTPVENEKDTKTYADLSKLLGFGSEIYPEVAKSEEITTPKDIRKLARFNKTTWAEEIIKANPKIKDQQLINTYASAMVRKMEREFPTQAFTAQLERAEEPVLKNQSKIVSFLNKHEDFDLLKDNVDLYLQKTKVSAKDQEAITDELKSVQRIFKLIPNYSKTIALRNENIHSSQHIISIGKNRFIKEIAPKAGIDQKEAEGIYHQAEARHTAAVIMLGNLRDNMSAMDIASIETTGLAKKLEAVSQDFPNLQSLFKLTDTCECQHCRSVYSPAAYLVEILQFLDKRKVVAKNAKSVLFSRRPELGEIDLNCANANTPVKYIDLVCEILEEAIAPKVHLPYAGKLSKETNPLKGKISPELLQAIKKAEIHITNEDGTTSSIQRNYQITEEALVIDTGILEGGKSVYYLRDKNLVFKIVSVGTNAIGENEYKIYPLRQTFGTAEELDAAPEYTNYFAYDKLSKSKFLFGLPFNLPHTEAKAYLSRFDVNRADLMKAFQVSGFPTDEHIAAEILGLTDAESNIIFNDAGQNTEDIQQSYWNVPLPEKVVDYLKRVNHLLDKTRISYNDLDLLLKLKFINPDGKLFIRHENASCDTASKEIANLNLAALDRIHRFLRLQKRTGWKLDILDEIITQKNLGGGKLDADCLKKVAQLKEISEKTNIKSEELIGFFGEIPHIVLSEDSDSPLYNQIFLNKAKNGVIEEAMLPKSVADGSQLISTYTGYIANSLQVKQKELESLSILLSEDKLTFTNLSFLLAAARLSKKLKLKAEDFATLLELSELDICSDPTQMLSFLKVAEEFKESPLKPADVKFLLQHRAINISDREVKEDRIKELLAALKIGYDKISTEQKSKYDDNLTSEEQQETLMDALAGLENMEEVDGKTIAGFVEKKWSNAADAKDFIDNKLNDNIDKAQIHHAIDLLAAVPDDADPESAAKGLVKVILNVIADYQIRNNKQSFLVQSISSAFKVDQSQAEVVLKYAILKQTAPGKELISHLLTDNFDNEISSSNYGQQFASIRLLYKILLLVKALELPDTDLEWYFKNNERSALNWFAFDQIPYEETGQVVTDLNTYLSFCKIVSYAKRFTPVANPVDEENPITFFSIAEMILSGAVANRDEFLYKLSLLTGYENDDLAAIDGYLFSAFDIAQYSDPNGWDRLFECAGLMRKLGAGIDQAERYITPVLTESEVADLRTALKSRYDEQTWLSTLKEIMDSIRPQKRDALVAYLLATNPGVKDRNDLYEYFLVDVEMEACMPSSRIVLAHNTVQLFVQRCLMGLEPEAIADVDNDPSWDQWKWMKNYRVWEANRKVFLYPENWYDVTLTDDKTYLLKEFIDELQQNELTNDTAEEAIKEYLEKLDNISFLEVMATWYEVPEKTLHVFARTKGGDPAMYYYRRFEGERYWSPWEKVDLDITGDHLLAFKRNNRLHLAWPIFSEETQPDQQTKIPSSTDQGKYIDPDRPKKKLKIQLAISEYANKNWQPKKVSKDAILTPNKFSSYADDFRRDIYNFKYIPLSQVGDSALFSDMVIVFSGYPGDLSNSQNLRGIFNIAGCKGYPELMNNQYLLSLMENTNFSTLLPAFNDTTLLNQKYTEQNMVTGDDLSVADGISIFKNFGFENILNATPGTFRISYPHQFTILDILSWGLQNLLKSSNLSTTSNGRDISSKRRLVMLPQGTLLPYFMEDSNHAYVIIPGFYKKAVVASDLAISYALNDSEQQTGSNAFQLLDDIANWYKRINADLHDNPPKNAMESFKFILSDPGFQNIIEKLSNYIELDAFLNMFVGKTDDPEIENFLMNLVQKKPLEYGVQFKNAYHPLVCSLRNTLYNGGISAFMKRDIQLQTNKKFDFKSYYNPNNQFVASTFTKKPDGTQTLNYPIEEVDFSSDGSYSAYNWDLFFRTPLHIATSLTQNQRFEEALTWFHYMFNPTGALPGNGVQKYWVTKPFYLNQETDYVIQRIETLMYAISDPGHPDVPAGASKDPAIRDLEFAISEWRKKPFRPDVVMRFRPVAYQKALLMKYIDNLTEWGDYLFRQDTMESVAQAIQMYILADKLLGPKPAVIPSAVKQPFETYNQLEAGLADSGSFGNTLVELENILPELSIPEEDADVPTPPITLSLLYFCIPGNEKMNEYWDRIADRLFKIRHCQNIDGVERSLALFAPPIDPGMLVRAAAAGLDISSVLAGLNAPAPYYRFNILSQKATELVQEVRGLGNSLLQALEKKDAESLSLLRSELELKVLDAVKDMKKLQINESKEQIEILHRTRKVTEERQQYYASIDKISTKEQLNLDKLELAHGLQLGAQISQALAGAFALLPDAAIGAAGFGGSPTATAKWGGFNVSSAARSAADVLNIFSSIAAYEANRASILGGYERRFDDWQLQESLATKELASIDQQIVAAEIRREIAETDLKNHELQIDNAQKTDEFMRSKFTNKELYDWMIGQVSQVYFKSYQLAHDFAKKAERCYRFELGNDDSFISYGYWDSMKKGLQSADHLIHDIKRMEASYIDKNKREYEIVKHVSLAQLDPLALVNLRAGSSCNFEIPEVLYDMDHPGQYFRRIKSVSISIPCIAGPYTSVSAKLSLVNNRYRKNINDASDYAEDPGNDSRFVYNVGAIQSIATSNAQNDSGVFELNFKDERYLPFENTGAISNWRLELPTEVKQFDYNTISDVIIHIRYTAREGGSVLRNAANHSLKERLDVIQQGLKKEGLHIAINLKHELPYEWQKLIKDGKTDLILDTSRLPYMTQSSASAGIDEVTFIAKVRENPATFMFQVDEADTELSWIEDLKMCSGSSSDVEVGTPFRLSVSDADRIQLEELLLIVKYKF